MVRIAGWVVAWAFLLVTLGGCVTKSSHTEGDREVNDQTMKAGEVVVAAAAQAADLIDAGRPAEAKSLLAQGAVAGAEIIKNAKQQEGVHGAAVAPAPAFSPEASEKARQKSTDDHASGKWVPIAMGIAGAALSVAATLAGMPWLAQLFPALTGKIGKMAKTGVQIITAARAAGEANGGTLQVVDLLKIAKDKNVSAGIQDLVTKHVDAHEEAMGHDFEIKLDAVPLVPNPA